MKVIDDVIIGEVTRLRLQNNAAILSPYRLRVSSGHVVTLLGKVSEFPKSFSVRQCVLNLILGGDLNLR